MRKKRTTKKISPAGDQPLRGFFYGEILQMRFFQFDLCSPLAAAEIATLLSVADPEEPERKVRHCTAIWDTGATSSMITESLAKKLELKSIGKTRISGVHGVEDAAVYRIDLIFGNGFVIPDVRVSEAADNGGFDVLIGMDIIGQGAFYVTGISGRLKACFQMPDAAFSRSNSFS